jgi:hypothetical protein
MFSTTERPRSEFCSDAHYKRAVRRWNAGLPADALPDGRRGRRKLGELTEAEQAFERGRQQGRLEATMDDLIDRVREIIDQRGGQAA